MIVSPRFLTNKPRVEAVELVIKILKSYNNYDWLIN